LPDGTPAPSSISATLKARGDMLDSGQYQLDNNDNAAEDK
jgi:NADH-quinone oxidoreductase subunit J